MASSDTLVPAQGASRRLVPRQRSTRRHVGSKLVRHLVLIVIVGIFMVPFIVMITTAFKTPDDIFTVPPRLWPEEWVLDNFVEATRAMPLLRYFGNSLFLVVLNVVGTLLSCPLVGYALAKLQWRGRGVVLATVLGTMMLPPQVTFIPLYLLWNDLGLVGSYWPLIIPHFLGTPFYIFLMRQFFMGIPDSLREAAIIDGASELRAYFQIMLPQAGPALATIAVFQFVATWTDFLLPLIYLNDNEMYTLSIGLYGFFSEHGVAWGPLMAACLTFSLPAVLLFIVAQRYFVQGVATSGLK